MNASSTSVFCGFSPVVVMPAPGGLADAIRNPYPIRPSSNRSQVRATTTAPWLP